MPNVPENVAGQPSNWYPLINTTGGSVVLGSGVPEGINWACTALASSRTQEKPTTSRKAAMLPILSRRYRLQRAALDDAIDDAVLQSLIGLQNVIAIHITRDAIHGLSRRVGENLIE